MVDSCNSSVIIVMRTCLGSDTWESVRLSDDLIVLGVIFIMEIEIIMVYARGAYPCLEKKPVLHYICLLQLRLTALSDLLKSTYSFG